MTPFVRKFTKRGDVMTEAEWLVSEDPQAMLEAITHPAAFATSRGWGQKVSDRKPRLFACACWRLRADRFASVPARQHQYRIADYGEAMADRLPLSPERPLPALDPDNDFLPLLPDATEAARRMAACNGTARQEAAAQAALLRDLFGNPFR